jgi:hypothetical protein
VDSGSIVHSYPFCWRSDTPLVYKAVPSWFVRVEEIKPQVGSRAAPRSELAGRRPQPLPVRSAAGTWALPPFPCLAFAIADVVPCFACRSCWSTTSRRTGCPAT